MHKCHAADKQSLLLGAAAVVTVSPTAEVPEQPIFSKQERQRCSVPFGHWLLDCSHLAASKTHLRWQTCIKALLQSCRRLRACKGWASATTQFCCTTNNHSHATNASAWQTCWVQIHKGNRVLKLTHGAAGSWVQRLRNQGGDHSRTLAGCRAAPSHALPITTPPLVPHSSNSHCITCVNFTQQCCRSG